jgi:NitT/TauT family transport system substrate-binding protein
LNKRAFLGLAAGAAGGALLATHSGVRAQDAPTIRIGTLISDNAAVPLYGVDTNMFAQAGLKVEVQPFTNYGALQGAIAGKALDVGILDTLATAVGASRGVPFTILAAASTQIAKSPTMLLCVAKSSPLRSGKELEGKTIAVASLGGSAEATLRAWLEKEGAEQSKVGLIEMPLPQMGPALERGTVAAAEIFEPALTVARLAGARPFGRVYDAVAPQFYPNVWVTTAEYVQANGALLKRLVSTVYKIAAWANAHQSGSGAILMKYSKLDPNVVTAMTRTQYSTALEPKLLQPLIDVGAKFSMLAAAVNGATLIAPGFLSGR